MRALFVLGLSLFMILTSMLVTPRLSYAEEKRDYLYKETSTWLPTKTAKELGTEISKLSDDEKAAGVAGCYVAIALFPPAALICGAVIAAGDIHDELE